MDLHILQLKTELAGAKKEKTEVDIKIKRCFLELNSYSNPYYKTSADIKAAEIEQIGDELFRLKNQLFNLEQKISELKSLLGEY